MTPLGGFSRIVDPDPGDVSHFAGPSCVPPAVTPAPADGRRAQLLLLVDAVLAGDVGYMRLKHETSALAALCVQSRRVGQDASLCLTTAHGAENFPPEQAELAVRRFLELA